MLIVLSNMELMRIIILVIVFVDLKIRLYLIRKASTVVFKTKILAMIRHTQNCVQMLLFCMTTNLVMGPADVSRFNVQAILIIA